MQPSDDLVDVNNPYRAPQTASTLSHVDRSVDDESTPFSPFKTIWLRPRETVRRIVVRNPALHVTTLACLAGVGQTLDRASMRNMGDDVPFGVILLLACTLGPVGGLISLWISSHLLRISGGWIGGIASREHLKTAIAWASVPSVVALILWVPHLALVGEEMFTEAAPRLDAQPVVLLVVSVVGFAEVVLAIWSFVLLCNTVAEVQGFRSAWSGLGNLLLAGALIIVPILVFVLGIALLAG